MQGSLVRVAGPEYQEDGVVPGGGREAPTPRQADANSVEDYCSHHWKDCSPVFGEI